MKPSQVLCPRCDVRAEGGPGDFRCPRCGMGMGQRRGHGVLPSSREAAAPDAAAPNRAVAPDARRVFVLAHPAIDAGAVPALLGLQTRGIPWTLVRSVREVSLLRARRYDQLVCVEGAGARFSRREKLYLLLAFAHAAFSVVRDGALTLTVPGACLATLLSPVSRWPLRHLTEKKVERLYRDYLEQPRPARAFAAEYLGHAPPSSGRAFDLGCGRGRYCAMLSQLGYEVTGLDLAPHDYWALVPNSRFYIGSAEDLDCFPDAQFDLVVSMLMLCYVPDDVSALAQAARLLKEGGRLVLQVPNRDNLRTRLTGKYLLPEPGLRRYYSIEDVEAKVRATGLRLVRCWTDKVYAPVCLPFFNWVYEFALPWPLQRLVCRMVPARYRGVINLVAEKVHHDGEMSTVPAKRGCDFQRGVPPGVRARSA